MKKIVLMLMAMVVFGQICGSQAFHEGSPYEPTTPGKKVSKVYWHPDAIIFLDGLNKIYQFAYDDNNVIERDRAKMILSILLTAQANGSEVIVNYDNTKTGTPSDQYTFSVIFIKK